MSDPTTSFYLRAFRGSFTSLLKWPDLDNFWEVLRRQTDKHWYIYAIGEPAPVRYGSAQELETFIREIDVLLREEHQHDYCGIVYVDDKADPHFIKIYDPNNLGVSCGFSNNPPLPGWVLSTLQPEEVNQTTFVPQNRRRWWQRLFAGHAAG